MKTTTLPALAAGWLIAMFASPALAAAPDAHATSDADLKMIPSAKALSPCPDQRVTIGLSGGSLVSVSVDLAVLRAELANGGTLLAGGAGIVLSERALDALLDTALNVVRANLLVEKAGAIYLEPRGAACSSMLLNASFVTLAGGVSGDSVTSLPVPPGASIPVFIVGGAGNPGPLPLRTPDFNIPNVPVAVTAGALPVGSGVSPANAPGTTGSTGAGSPTSTPGVSIPTPGVSTPPNSGSNGVPVANAPGTTGSTGAGSPTPTPGVSLPTPGVSTPPNPGRSGNGNNGVGNGNNGFGNGGGDGSAGKSGKSDGKR